MENLMNMDGTKTLAIGDAVTIKNKLEMNLDIVPEMKVYSGKKAQITDCSGDRYFLDIDKGFWAWTEDMLERA